MQAGDGYVGVVGQKVVQVDLALPSALFANSHATAHDAFFPKSYLVCLNWSRCEGCCVLSSFAAPGILNMPGCIGPSDAT